MPLQKKTSRRRIIKAGLASAASLAVSMPNSYAAKTASELKPKAKGETKVVFLGGDYLHNGETQEMALRGVFYSQESTKNYRFIKSSGLHTCYSGTHKRCRSAFDLPLGWRYTCILP